MGDGGGDGEEGVGKLSARCRTDSKSVQHSETSRIHLRRYINVASPTTLSWSTSASVRETTAYGTAVSSGVQTYLGPATSTAAVDELAALGNLKISHVQSRVGERCCGATAAAYRKRGERGEPRRRPRACGRQKLVQRAGPRLSHRARPASRRSVITFLSSINQYLGCRRSRTTSLTPAWRCRHAPRSTFSSLLVDTSLPIIF